jgi:hypothetical protein
MAFVSAADSIGDAADCARRIRACTREREEIARDEQARQAHRLSEMNALIRTIETGASEAQAQEQLRACGSIRRSLDGLLQGHLDTNAAASRLMVALDAKLSNGSLSPAEKLSAAEQARVTAWANIRDWEGDLDRMSKTRDLWAELAGDVRVLYEIMGTPPPVDLRWRACPIAELEARVRELAEVKAEALTKIRYLWKSGPDHLKKQEALLRTVACQITRIMAGFHLTPLEPTSADCAAVAFTKTLYQYSDQLALEVTLGGDGNCGFEFVRLGTDSPSDADLLALDQSATELRALLPHILDAMNRDGLDISIEHKINVPSRLLKKKPGRNKARAHSQNTKFYRRLPLD